MKKTYLAPQTKPLIINFERGILVYSGGKGGATASAMSQNDEVFDDWD